MGEELIGGARRNEIEFNVVEDCLLETVLIH